MLYRFLAGFFCTACAMVMLSGCGDSKAGAITEFATVQANPAGAVFAGSDGTLDAAAPDLLPVTLSINSVPYTTPNTGSSSTIGASNLLIDRVSVSLRRADTTSPANLPALASSQFSPFSPGTIAPGTNAITVQVQTAALKTFLQSNLAAGAQGSYWVSFSVDAHESISGKSGSINFPDQLKIIFTNS